MKPILPLILVLTIVFSTAHAQISIEGADYYPVVGDTLRSTTDFAPTGIVITAPGGDQTWDFSGLQSGDVSDRIIQAVSDAPNPDAFPGADAYIGQQIVGNGFYSSTAASFSIIGYEGEDPLGQGIEVVTPFNPPYVEQWGSLNFFDLNDLSSSLTITVAVADIPGNLFDQLPLTPDSIRVRIVIDRTDLVDAWGNLTIPGGSYDVLREKRTEIRDIRLDAKVSVLPWFDVTDTAIELLPIDELGTDTTVTYTYWSDEAKEPIAVLTTNASESAITSVEFKYLDIVSDVTGIELNKPHVSIFPNPVVIQAKLKFSGMPKGNYNLEIYNLTGQAVWSKKYYINGESLETINVSELRKGMYLYVLSNEDGKRLQVNRLIVQTP